LFEGGASGQTPGKRALKIRVVDVQDDVSIGYIRALLRFIVSWVSLIVLFIGYLSMLGEPSGQTWHDIAARSLVVDWPRAGPPSD
ncbi:MAG: RDD family protein, partial [Solirubrobacterales bacterium]|nr:RDD family protein [Solirubrobacterales bacterium]